MLLLHLKQTAIKTVLKDIGYCLTEIHYFALKNNTESEELVQFAEKLL